MPPQVHDSGAQRGANFWGKEDVKEHFCELKFVTLSAVHQGAPGKCD